MNAPAHLNPVVLVIDPLSDPRKPQVIPYTNQIALAASGMVMAKMSRLAKLQRGQTFEDAEAFLAAAWRKEVCPNQKPVNPATKWRPGAECRMKGALAAARIRAEKRNARYDSIIAALRERGPLTREDIGALFLLGESNVKRVMDEMAKEGLVSACRPEGSRRVVYEVPA